MNRVLETEADVEALITSEQPAWLLKHSRTCPISTAALKEFKAYVEAHPDQPSGVVVVQDQRPLSNWIEQRLKYTHQSPQAFLLCRGQVVWCGSHWGITADAMIEATGSRVMQAISVAK
jgi:bacillithiol system protein YtxJ